MRIKYRFAAAFALLAALCAICGCSTASAARPVAEHVTPVYIPTPVACIDPAKVPVEPRHVAGDLNRQARHDLDNHKRQCD